jgi:hypothetical protein
MDEWLAGLLIVVLRALFELLVPRSLDLAARELLIALLVTGAAWLWNWLRERRWREPEQTSRSGSGPRAALWTMKYFPIQTMSER